jgi:hypothetical protein
MPVQKVVHRRQCHRPPQARFELGLDLADHQDAAAARTVQKRGQHLALLLGTHVLVPAPATRLALAIANDLAGQEAIAQTTRPRHRAADGARCLLKAQSIVQRQHHRLSLPQLLDGLRLRQHRACPLQVVRTSCSPRHVHLLYEISTPR